MGAAGCMDPENRFREQAHLYARWRRSVHSLGQRPLRRSLSAKSTPPKIAKWPVCGMQNALARVRAAELQRSYSRYREKGATNKRTSKFPPKSATNKRISRDTFFHGSTALTTYWQAGPGPCSRPLWRLANTPSPRFAWPAYRLPAKVRSWWPYWQQTS